MLNFELGKSHQLIDFCVIFISDKDDNDDKEKKIHSYVSSFFCLFLSVCFKKIFLYKRRRKGLFVVILADQRRKMTNDIMQEIFHGNAIDQM